ncbi:hypothetical protein [Oricola cellulosilytica]|uniref:Uncharacterized protein n=1 Tax=Oricola cellulosilytica TaxID=1429082 RepID=A0A4R0PI04_9HYPH|nr:hypothetical protein [Oricola cellulosilytica]TCD15184.1 hypothetical protein E0D97_06455 [Oricola cellulosilytica]
MFQRLFTKSVPQQRLEGAIDHLSDREAQEALRARSAAMIQRLERRSSEARRKAVEEQEARLKAITTPPRADDGLARRTQPDLAESPAPVIYQSATDSETDRGVPTGAMADCEQYGEDEFIASEEHPPVQHEGAEVKVSAADPDDDELRRTAEEAKVRIAARLKAREEGEGAEPSETEGRLDFGHDVPPLVDDGEPVDGG